MKQIQLFLMFFLMSSLLHSQINPFNGIIDVAGCKFETPCELTQLYMTPLNIWQIGKPQKPFFDSAYSTPNALVTDTINPYATSNHSYFDLILPVWAYYPMGIIVGFKHKFQTDTLIDGGFIEDSYDNGLTWVNVLDDQLVHDVPEFHSENLYTYQNTLQGDGYGFSGNSGGWIYTRIQWVWGYIVKDQPPDTLMLRFHFISDSIQTNKDGWIIDNILISYADEGMGIKEAGVSPIKINVQPNPFDDFTSITFSPSVKEPLTLNLINSYGKIVREVEHITGNKLELRREGLLSGIYFIQFYSGKSFLGVKKLIIM